jgi:hypothetical protein
MGSKQDLNYTPSNLKYNESNFVLSQTVLTLTKIIEYKINI